MLKPETLVKKSLHVFFFYNLNRHSVLLGQLRRQHIAACHLNQRG